MALYHYTPNVRSWRGHGHLSLVLPPAVQCVSRMLAAVLMASVVGVGFRPKPVLPHAGSGRTAHPASCTAVTMKDRLSVFRCMSACTSWQ